MIFINSGDKLTSNTTIAAVINSIGNNTYDVIYGAYREIYSGDKKSPIIPCRRPQKIWYGPVASHQSVFYRLDFLRTYNLKYDESYKIAADYKLTAQAIKNAKSILQLNICISYFDVSGISSTNQDLGLIEANRVRREVFCWGTIRIYSLSIVLLSARYLKSYLKPLYCLMRYGKIR